MEGDETVEREFESECCECGIPLRRVLRRIEGKDYCCLCFDMYTAIAENKFMQRQHKAWEKRQAKIRGMIDGNRDAA